MAEWVSGLDIIRIKPAVIKIDSFIDGSLGIGANFGRVVGSILRNRMDEFPAWVHITVQHVRDGIA